MINGQDIAAGVAVGATGCLLLVIGGLFISDISEKKALNQIEAHCILGAPIVLKGVAYDCVRIDYDPLTIAPLPVTPPQRKGKK